MKKLVGEKYQVDLFKASTLKSSIKCRAIVRRDVSVDLALVEDLESNEMDFSVLSLSKEISDWQPLTIGDSSAMQSADPVYALGFPAAVEWQKSVNNYTKDDVNVTDGVVSQLSSVRYSNEYLGGDCEMPVILHTALLSGGNSGGPLVNQRGEVVGVNTYYVTSGQDEQVSSYNSIQINEVVKYLDAFGVEYITAASPPGPEPDTEPDTEPESESEKESSTASAEDMRATLLLELQNAISEAESLDMGIYTDASAELLNNALENAKDVEGDPNATEDDLSDAAANLEIAQDGLEEKSAMSLWLIVACIAAVIVIFCVIIILVALNSSKKKQKRNNQSPGAGRVPVSEPPKVFPNAGGASPYTSPPGETSVLDAGAGETTVLGGGQGQSSACLIRRKNGERININGNPFYIGKERSKVNYCISDNTSISRVHSSVVRKGGEFFIIDQDSTNATYVNGNKIAPGHETMLKNGDSVKLSDETFEFKKL